MTLFQQIVFKIPVILLIPVQIFALQIEAPLEVEEQIAVYAKEAGAENRNATLTVRITKEKGCTNYSLKLLESNKVVNKLENCSSDLPNIALQNSVFELLGHDTENRDNSLLLRIGVPALFAISSLILYYTEIPQPVSLEGK